MRAVAVTLRLLEAACAVIAMLLVLLLMLAADYEALRATYHNGGLTRGVMVFLVVCAAWLVLWLKRTKRRMPAWLAIALLTGGVCVVVIVATAGGTARSTDQERHVEPTPTDAPSPPAPPPSRP